MRSCHLRTLRLGWLAVWSAECLNWLWVVCENVTLCLGLTHVTNVSPQDTLKPVFLLCFMLENNLQTCTDLKSEKMSWPLRKVLMWLCWWRDSVDLSWLCSEEPSHVKGVLELCCALRGRKVLSPSHTSNEYALWSSLVSEIWFCFDSLLNLGILN